MSLAETLMRLNDTKSPHIRSEHPLLPEAQAEELKQRFAAHFLLADPQLKVGDIVVEKAGLGYLPDRTVCVIWQLLNGSNWQDRLIVADWFKCVSTDRVDCLIAFLSPIGDTPGRVLRTQPHSTLRLELFSEKR